MKPSIADRVVSETVAELRAKRLPLRVPERPSWEHQRISRMRADHDRVSKAEFETELRLSRLANDGQQSEAARALDVTEGALRHWRNPDKSDCLPPRWAVELLRSKRQEASQLRKVAG